MIEHIPNKHIKTLTRRLNYLLSLGEDANSYDKAEIGALSLAVDVLNELKENQEEPVGSK